jgi:predicted nucleotidyltransferase
MQPIAAQSHLRYPLTRLLANGGAVRVLRSLCLFGGPLSVSQLAQETSMTPQGVRLALNALVGQQVISVLGQGRATLYELDIRHPLALSLKTLFADEQSQWENLMRDLRATVGKLKDVEAAWYYGSVARGEDLPNSDMDIAIVVTVDPEAATDALREALREIERTYAVTCSVIGVALADVREMAKGNAWWQEMARDAKVLKGMLPDRLVQRQRKAA